MGKLYKNNMESKCSSSDSKNLYVSSLGPKRLFSMSELLHNVHSSDADSEFMIPHAKEMQK